MQFNDRLNVCIDFDGTLVRWRHPDIGPDVPGAFEACREMAAGGAKLILLTMRDGQLLHDAVAHCRERGVGFFALNDNPDQNHWTKSRKVFGHFYIDDAAIGCPLLPDVPARKGKAPRGMVDWAEVMRILRVAPQPS